LRRERIMDLKAKKARVRNASFSHRDR
jgi:hypothetical protein